MNDPNIDKLIALLAGSGITVHCCDEFSTHYQLRSDSGTLVDYWPTTDKYRGHRVTGKQKAKHGQPHEVANFAKQIAGNMEAKEEAEFQRIDGGTNERDPGPKQADMGGLCRQLWSIMAAHNIASLKITGECEAVAEFYEEIPGIPF